MDVRIAPWLKVGTNTFISFLNYSGECPNINSIVRMPSVVMPQNDEGEWIVSPNGGNIKNPFLAYLSDDLDKRHQINTTVYGIVNIPFVKGLSYRINYNYTTGVTNQYNYNQYEASEKGEASKYIGNTYYWLVDNIVNYSNTFGNHHLDATFVYGCNRRSEMGPEHWENNTRIQLQDIMTWDKLLFRKLVHLLGKKAIYIRWDVSRTIIWVNIS